MAITDVYEAVINHVRSVGGPYRMIYMDKAPSKNEPVPYAIYKVIPGSLTFTDYFDKDKDDYNFAIELIYISDTTLGHGVIYGFADEMKDGLDNNKFDVPGFPEGEMNCEDGGSVEWDVYNTSILRQVYSVFGSLA